MNRLTEINSGRIALDGEDVTGADTDVNELRKQVGMVFQEFNVVALVSVENVALGPKKVLGMDAATPRPPDGRTRTGRTARAGGLIPPK